MAFHGKVALVTGGASGMGKVSALRLAAAGAQVAIFDMNEAALAETAAQSPNIRAWRCNVADWEEVQARVADVERELGPIDRLTHAAGIILSGREVPDSAAVLDDIEWLVKATTTPVFLGSLFSSRFHDRLDRIGAIALGDNIGAGLAWIESSLTPRHSARSRRD